MFCCNFGSGSFVNTCPQEPPLPLPSPPPQPPPLQPGDTWAPTMASNQVDTYGKQLLTEEPDYICKYKGLVKVGLLGMVDDLAGVSEVK